MRKSPRAGPGGTYVPASATLRHWIRADGTETMGSMRSRPKEQSTPVTGPPSRTRRLSTQECWSSLRRHRAGRLGYTSGRGPRHVVLPYVVWGSEVVLRVPAYNEAAQQAGGRRVTFDLVSDAEGGAPTRIEVVGRARLGEPEGGVLEALPDEHWPADLPSRLVYLEVDDLLGVAGDTGPGVTAGL